MDTLFYRIIDQDFNSYSYAQTEKYVNFRIKHYQYKLRDGVYNETINFDYGFQDCQKDDFKNDFQKEWFDYNRYNKKLEFICYKSRKESGVILEGIREDMQFNISHSYFIV